MFFFPSLRLLSFLLLALALLSFFAYTKHLKHRIHSLETERDRLKTELVQTRTDLEVCQKAYQELAQKVTVQEKEYRLKVAQLLKKAGQPVRYIEIPKVIEKPVPIPAEDCQKMANMIDQYLEVSK